MKKPQISMIAAIGKHRELGRKNELLWRIPDDLKRFKKMTLHHPIVMGRKTFESIGKPLPERMNIVVTRNKEWEHEGVYTASSVEEGLVKAAITRAEEIFIIGGAQIYKEGIDFADTLYLTLVDAEARDADVFFPAYEKDFPTVVKEEVRESEGLEYRWVELGRKG